MTTRIFEGLPAAPGLVSGPAFIWQDVDLTLPVPYPCTDVEAAWKKILKAIESAKQELVLIRTRIETDLGREEAEIFAAHLMMVEDVALLDMVKSALKKGTNPEAAWFESIETFAGMLENIPDDLLKARAVDIRDVGQRVLAHLLGKSFTRNVIDTPVVVVARDLTPSQTATMDRRFILAFCTAEGGPTSHTAILSKTLGIPAIVALGKTILSIAPEEFLLVDANAGRVIYRPTSQEKMVFEQHVTRNSSRDADDLKAALQAAITKDGRQVEVFANIGGPEDVEVAIAHGAEGIGLFRTEFIYLNRSTMPGIDQQLDAYRSVIKALAGRPLVVRTMDIGGDKQVDYLGITAETNPFLGWRGIRMITERPDFLRDQFYALLRAGQGTDLRIMLPMVSQVEEVVQARKILDQVLQDVKADVPGYSVKLQYGMMVEVPSAALMIEHFAPHVDFFSIGTNDLTQYTLAMDRTNSRLAPYASPFHPAVLKLIASTVSTAHEHGKWVGMCGEFAGEPAAIPFLLGIGLDEFSMAAKAIPPAKQLIRRFSVQECQGIAQKVLRLPGAKETRAFLKDVYAS
jgi:phosphoenolpyruvate-protein phosphotransferase